MSTTNHAPFHANDTAGLSTSPGSNILRPPCNEVHHRPDDENREDDAEESCGDDEDYEDDEDCESYGSED